MSSACQFDFDADLRRYETLLEMADLMVRYRELPGFFASMAERLRDVVASEFVGFALHDAKRSAMRLYLWHGHELAPAPIEVPVADTFSGWVWQNQQPLVIPDLQLDTRFPAILQRLKDKGLRSHCWLPLTTAQAQLGTLGLGSSQVNSYGEKDVQLLLRIAELVAIAVENALTRDALAEERERLQSLLEVNTKLVAHRDPRSLLSAISGPMKRMIRHDYASVAVYDEAAQALTLYPLDGPPADGWTASGKTMSIRDTPAGHALAERTTKTFSGEDLAGVQSTFVNELLEEGIRSLCCVPLITRKGELGTLNLASTEENAFQTRDINLLEQVAAQVALALDTARAYREIAELTDKLAKEKLYLEDEIRTELNFEEIVGESPVLKRALAQAKTVAPSNATVIVLGETGTGKELIARAIHRMSARKEGSFIKLNCAAIPTGLLESELFGHERGAFTGAISQKVGRLELADKGTLFLDEVGDIPLELQPKLLRVLQDQEFERLGSTRTTRVDIRLIAATNRDLGKRVAEREFRSDLYYRLHVFPIRLPALRERPTDIPLLVRYFVQKFARRMNKQIDTIPTEAMNALVSWEWPGNVRELENFIERSVILSDGPILSVPLTELRPGAEAPCHSGTLESVERQHIIHVLRETRGVIAGARGAAALLGLKRTTLQSRILRMGISRQEYEI